MPKWLRLQETWNRITHRKSTLPTPSGERSQQSQVRKAILLVTQDDALRHSLCALGHVYKWEVTCTATREMAIEILRNKKMPLVICDQDTPEDWRKTVRVMAFLPQSTCILLASQDASQSLQNEVRKHHGYDVIRKPWRFQEVADRVAFAWSWYRSGCASWWGPPPKITLVKSDIGLDG